MNFIKAIPYKDIINSFKYYPRVVKLLWSTNKKYFTYIMLLNIFFSLTPMLELIATKNLINSISLQPLINNSFIPIFYSFLILIIINLIAYIVSLLKNYYESIYQNLLSCKINIDIMNKANNLSLSDLEDSKIYDKLQRAKNEASYRPFEIFQLIVNLVSVIITLISCSSILFLWKWWPPLLLIILPAFSTLKLIKQGQKEFNINYERASKHREVNYISYLLTNDLSFKEIKLNNIGDFLLKEYSKIFSNFINQDKSLLNQRNIISLFFDLLNKFVSDFIILIILFSTFTGNILIGNLVAYIQAVNLTKSNSKSIINILFSLYSNNLYINQLFQFLDLTNISSTEINHKNIKIDNINKIEFINVSFKYPKSNKYALKNISFEINKNDIIALVGENGSGKSTLLKLIAKLYIPTSGKILINSILIEDIDTIRLRELLGFTLQDFIKYQFPIRFNIGFGNLKSLYTDTNLLIAADNADIGNFIKLNNNNLDTQLGNWFNDGVELSGGQWQKLAISRAFIKNAEVYLLDEPSASLDPISEKKIFTNFFNLVEKKIGIFTSHRFLTVKYASKILVLKDGSIVENGTHDELLKFNSYYKTLYDNSRFFHESSDTIKM